MYDVVDGVDVVVEVFEFDFWICDLLIEVDDDVFVNVFDVVFVGVVFVEVDDV